MALAGLCLRKPLGQMIERVACVVLFFLSFLFLFIDFFGPVEIDMGAVALLPTHSSSVRSPDAQLHRKLQPLSKASDRMQRISSGTR